MSEEPDCSQPVSRPPRLGAVGLGILLMIVAVGGFATMGMLVKLVGPDYHPFEAVFFRNTLAALLVVPFVLHAGGIRTLKTKRPGGHLLRSLGGVASNASYFAAYQLVPLADGMTVSLAVPIFATLLAIPMLGERVGGHRWAAVIVGFGGILIALNPTGTIALGSLFALLGTVLWAVTMVYVRKLAATENPYAIVFYYMVIGSVVAACAMPWVWVTPTAKVLLLYCGAGVVGGVAQIAMTFALKLAPASVVSPFEYTKIIWAVLFDLTIWGTSPAGTTLIGAAVVVATGLYIFRRESRQDK